LKLQIYFKFFLQLLQKDVTKRLGVASNIKDHSFFASIDFDRLEKRQIEPPFKPKVVSNIKNLFLSSRYRI